MFSTSSRGSWINAIFHEIALEGLEGTTLPCKIPATLVLIHCTILCKNRFPKSTTISQFLKF